MWDSRGLEVLTGARTDTGNVQDDSQESKSGLGSSLSLLLKHRLGYSLSLILKPRLKIEGWSCTPHQGKCANLNKRNRNRLRSVGGQESTCMCM
jgi:hypothetical protein